MSRRNLKTPEELRAWRREWCLDLLAAYFFASGAAAALFYVMGFDTALWYTMALTLLDLALLAVLVRFWWILPSAVVLAAAGVGVYAIVTNELKEVFLYWSKFFQWWAGGMPELLPYSENGSVFLVQFLLLLPVAAVSYLLLRKCFSLLLLSALTVGTAIALFELGYREITVPFVLMLLCLLLSFPRMYYRQALKREPGTAKVSRTSVQALGVPIAAVCLLTALLITPARDGVWRNKFLVTRLNDVRSYIDYLQGDLAGHSTFRIETYGYMPNGDQLGGDIDPDNTRILTLYMEQPQLLRGRVYDMYTGKRWGDARANGSFRFNSLLWRGRRNQVYNMDLPVGGEEAKALYSRMSTTSEYQIRYIVDVLKTIFAGGRVLEYRYANETRMDAYFDLQGELFMPYNLTFSDVVRIRSQNLDRSLEGFDENMLRLQELALQGEDPNWESVCTQYLQLPDSLPDRVRRTAEELTYAQETPYEKALALESWLKENCTYTNTPGDVPEGEDFVDYFLATRKGYCTYYATAMAVMARTLGIPARYVTGFSLGTVEGTSPNTYYATSSTAHAWCEVYLQGIGWVTFDPVGRDNTAPLEEFTIQENGQETADPSKPAEEETDGLETEEEQELAEKEEEAANRFNFFLPLLAILGLVLCLILLRLLWNALLLRVHRRYRLTRVVRKVPQRERQLDLYYTDILRQLAILGLPVRDGETILTYGERVDRGLHVPSSTFEAVGRVVMAARFAQRAPTVQEIERLYFYHADLERQLREDLGDLKYFWTRVIRK